VTVVGLVGFLSSSVYSVALLNATPTLQNHTTIFAPIIGGVAGTTVFPLVVATILAYCVTGYVRDELYHPFVKGCVGVSCNAWIIVLTFVYFLLWLVMAVLLGAVTAVYIQLAWGCPQIGDLTGADGLACFQFGSDDSGSLVNVCVRELGDLCSVGLRIGLSFAISLGFSVIVIIGLVLMLIVQAANFVGVRESNKRSYRPGGDY